MEEVYTALELAKMLKICQSKIYSMAKRGEIPSVKIGKNVRFLKSVIVQ